MSDCKRNSECIEAPNPKKLKESDKADNGVNEIESKLKKFIPEKVLNNSTNRKTICVQGRFDSESGIAIVLLDKNAFTPEEVNDNNGYFANETIWQLLFENDIYTNAVCYPRSELNGVRTTVIFPATEKHIAKYSSQQIHIILETPEWYEKYTLPYLEKEQFTLQWVYNVLDGKSEQDRVVYDNKCERDGFLLLPDLKWDGKTRETLYLLAIVRQRGLKSLRDLTAAHLALLRNIRREGKKAIWDRYQVPGSQLRIYLHYQPSFYHLHVHFTYLRHEAPGIYAEKSHLLDTVIDNIEMMPDYYKVASLPFTLREKDNLFKVYESNGFVARVSSYENSDLIVK